MYHTIYDMIFQYKKGADRSLPPSEVLDLCFDFQIGLNLVEDVGQILFGSAGEQTHHHRHDQAKEEGRQQFINVKDSAP